jgi:hypothetical protein
VLRHCNLGAAGLACLAFQAPAATLMETSLKAVVSHGAGLADVGQLIESTVPEKTHTMLAGVVSMAPLLSLDTSPMGPRSHAFGPLAARTDVVPQRRAVGTSRQRIASSETASAPWYITVVSTLLAAFLTAAVSLRIAARARRDQVRDLAEQRMRDAERERLEDLRREQEIAAQQRRNERQDRDAEYQSMHTVLQEANTLVVAANRTQVLFDGDYDFDGLQRHIDRIVGNGTPPDLKPSFDKLAVCIRDVRHNVLPTQDDFDASHPRLTGTDYTAICLQAAKQRTAVEELSTAHCDAYEALRTWARVDI